MREEEAQRSRAGEDREGEDEGGEDRGGEDGGGMILKWERRDTQTKV